MGQITRRILKSSSDSRGLGAMKKNAILLSLTMILSIIGVTNAKSETLLNAQILQSDLTLSKLSSPYRILGVIQVPKGIRFNVDPGVKVFFGREGGIKSAGEIRIGSSSSTDRVEITHEGFSEIFGKGLIPPKIEIFNADFIGSGSSLLTFGCQSLRIENSYFKDFFLLVREQECQSMVIKGSYFRNVQHIYEGFFDGYPQLFDLDGNIFEGMLSLCCAIRDRTMGGQKSTATFRVTNNEFVNLRDINIPYGYTNYTFSRNNFYNTSNVRLFGYVPEVPTQNLSSNFWLGMNSDAAIRSTLKVTDSLTDIALPKAVIFEPLLTQPVAIASSAPALRLRIQQNEAKAKAEAEAKAKAEVEAKAKAEAEAKAKAEVEARAAYDSVLAEYEEVLRRVETLVGKLPKEKSLVAALAKLKSLSISSGADLTKAKDQIMDAKATSSFYEMVLFQAAKSPTTITCVKGKLTKKVTAVNPKCPKGYKKK